MVIREFTDEHMASRLMSMGVLPGTIIEIDRIAPWRGGYCLKVQGQKIALRYAEAASIIVE
jgi:ferrous iron transport protein A